MNNREQWLYKLKDKMEPKFNEYGYLLSSNLEIVVKVMRRGLLGTYMPGIKECKVCKRDFIFFIYEHKYEFASKKCPNCNCVMISDKESELFEKEKHEICISHYHRNGSIGVAETLCHELIHMAIYYNKIPHKQSHGPEFRFICVKLGLKPNTRSMATGRFITWIKPFIDELGMYPDD